MSGEPTLTKKYFSIDDANRMLPLVRAIVRDVVKEYERLERLQDDSNAGSAKSDDIEAVRDELHALVEELQQLGLSLKDFKMGLVDFPHQREGREVNLCWHLGEENVSTWHEIDSGFAGRQPL